MASCDPIFIRPTASSLANFLVQGISFLLGGQSLGISISRIRPLVEKRTRGELILQALWVSQHIEKSVRSSAKALEHFGQGTVVVQLCLPWFAQQQLLVWIIALAAVC